MIVESKRSKSAVLLLLQNFLIFDIMNFFVIVTCFVYNKALNYFVLIDAVNEKIIHELS